MEEQRKQGIILVGVGVDCVSIVEQAVHELKETTEIKGIAFDRADRYEELMDRSYPQLDVEKIPTVDFDKLLVCCKNCIMKECVELFCEEFNLSRTKCGSYITPKIGPRKIDWDRVKCKDDIAEQIRCSGTMNDLERFFYTKQHREIYKWIHYFEIYDRHFAKYRGKAPLVMEIGVFHGGSVQMWKDYFGKEATIIGVDIDPSTKIFEEDQIHIEIGSQSDREFLRQLKQKYPRIDVLIDDGGHTMEQQITTLEEMFGHLSDDGVYLCEDLHTSYWKERGGGYKCPNSFIEYSKALIDRIHAWYSEDPVFQEDQYSRSIHSLHYYDSILVIEKEKMGPAVELMIGGEDDKRDIYTT